MYAAKKKIAIKQWNIFKVFSGFICLFPCVFPDLTGKQEVLSS